MAKQIFKMFRKKLSKKEAIVIIKKKYLQIKKLKEDINTMAKKYELKDGKLVEQTNEEQTQDQEIPEMEETPFNNKILNEDERMKIEQEILENHKIAQQHQQQMQQMQQMKQQPQQQHIINQAPPQQQEPQEQYNLLIVVENTEAINITVSNITETMKIISNAIDEQQSITVGGRIVNGKYIVQVIPTKL